MNFLRPIAAIAVIVAAILVSNTYSEHHEGDNAFLTLYHHVVPARLVNGGAHHEAPEGEHAENGEHAGEHGPAHGRPNLMFMAELGLLPAAMDGAPEHEGVHIVLTNLQIFQIAAVLLIFILFTGVPTYLRTGRGDYLTRLFAGFSLYVRDEMVYPVMGKELGSRFLVWFLSIFFFILFMNLMGLVPGSATATASIFVTAALACITLTAMLVCGMLAQGPIAFWKNLVPHVPLALWPLMFVVELMGLFVKPFALMIRLFANMTGGHMVVLSFMGLIFYFATNTSAVIAWSISPIAVAFAVLIMIIEVFVALLQAYVFTQLSIMFVGSSVHPEH